MCSSEEEGEYSHTFSEAGSMNMDTDIEAYNYELDKILEKFEVAAKNEDVYLLQSTYTIGSYVIGVGLSPARSFSPAVILTYQQHKISFCAYEWSTFINLIKLRIEDFFNDPAVAATPIIYPCGDFCKLTQMIRDDDVKVLELLKYNTAFYLSELDILKIIDINSKLIVHRIAALEDLNFCAYYYSVIDVIKTHCSTKNSECTEILNILQLCLDLCFPANMNGVGAFKEYLYFYESSVLKDISK